MKGPISNRPRGEPDHPQGLPVGDPLQPKIHDVVGPPLDEQFIRLRLGTMCIKIRISTQTEPTAAARLPKSD